jgi:hypothetical protein
MSPSPLDLPGIITIVVLSLIVLCGLVRFVGWPLYYRITLRKIITLISQLRDMDEAPFFQLMDYYAGHPEWVADGFTAVMSDVTRKLYVAHYELSRLERNPKSDQAALTEKSMSVAALEVEFKVCQEDNANFYYFVDRLAPLKRPRKTT